MHTPYLFLALAPLANLATADADFDQDDVPRVCRDICRPIDQLTERCDVDLRSDNDRDENLLEWQCVCTNDSFDVAGIAALCADCMQQNLGNGSDNDNDDDNDDDDDGDDYDNNDRREDLEDIGSIMNRCGFSSTTYATSDSTAASGITVQATAPTAASQLTTTITGTKSWTSQGSTPTQTSTSNSGDSSSDSTNNNDDTSTNADDSEPTDNAAPAIVPLGFGSGFGLLYLTGAVAAGAMIMFQ